MESDFSCEYVRSIEAHQNGQSHVHNSQLIAILYDHKLEPLFYCLKLAHSSFPGM